MTRTSGSVTVKVLAIAMACAWTMTATMVSAAPAPTLTKHRDYVATSPHLRIAFISHSATVIDLATPNVGGSQYETGGMYFSCPAVSAKALVNPGFSQITLKKKGAFYGFSLSYTVDNVNAGYPGQASTTLGQVQVRLTGRVTSASTISGTAQLIGVPCSTSAYSYVARIDPAVTKYIAPNA